MTKLRSRKDAQAIEVYYRQHGLRKAMEFFGLNKNQVLGVVKRVTDAKKKVTEKLTPESLQALRARAIRSMRRHSHAEDFGSYAVLRALQGRKATLAQLKADFLRETFGRSGWKNTVELSPNVVSTKTTELSWNAVADRAGIEGAERAIFLLTYQWGFTGEEAAEVFGVTKPRISQILTAVKARLREFIERNT